jgi:hypothetical protein
MEADVDKRPKGIQTDWRHSVMASAEGNVNYNEVVRQLHASRGRMGYDLT